MSNLVTALKNAAFIIIQGETFRITTYVEDDNTLYYEDEETGDEHQILLEELEVMSIELLQLTKMEW